MSRGARIVENKRVIAHKCIEDGENEKRYLEIYKQQDYF